MGAVSLPLVAGAGLLSSLLGENAEASTEDAKSSLGSTNSQTLALLESSNSPFALLDNKDKKKEEEEKEPDLGEIKEDATVHIADNALLPVTSPLGVSDGSYIEEEEIPFDDEVSIYVVKKGDTLSQIAKMFDITVDTILSANELSKGTKIQEGDLLLILPYSGVEHVVTKGQTLQAIAKLYKTDVDSIILANHLEGTKIVVGDKLIIPGGEIITNTSSPSKSTSIAKGSGSSGSSTSISGYFTHPLPGSVYVRGLSSSHKGVDFGAPTGTPIHAAASGRVIAAKNGYNGGFGNVVFIQHPNGTQTVYGHMSKIATITGAQVNKGDIIGYVGSTGRSTGPHLHFEVRGIKNPFSR